MGFSLRKMLEGAAAQVNPFDGGKTYSTVQRQAPAQTPPPQQNVIQRAAPTGLRAGLGAAVATLPGAMPAMSAYKLLNRTKPGKAVLAGGRRSAIGTAQAVSGLVDLATPGTGTNRISKGLDQQAKQIDQSVKDQRLNPVLYKGGQLGGDIATGMGAGGAAKWAGRGLVKAAPVLSKIPKAVSAVEMGVAKAVAPMASKNLGGRIVAKTVQNVANPKYQGVNALYTAQQTGKDASQGKQITRQRVATDAAIGGLAFPAAGAIAGQTARAAAAPVVNKLKNAHLIRPTGLSDSEVAHLNRFVENRGTNGMTEDVYSKGVAAAQKAGVSTNDVSAMDRVIGDHMTFNTRQAVRKETLQNIKDRLSTPLGEGGYVKVPGKGKGSSGAAEITENPQVTSFIKDYADMLKGIEESGGVSIMPDGTRQSSHGSFYSDYYRQYKRKPSMQAYIEHAREQLESGRGDQFAIQEYNRVKAEANNPELQSLLGQMPEKELTDIEKNKINADKLRREVINYKNTLTPVKKTGGEVNVPVRAIKQQGDVVTATNVNPNIKAAEKRYTMNENGDLLPDQNGAYRMFHDQDGKITGFRVGNEYFDSKTLGDLSQVNNYGSVFATMRRNIERSFGGETSAKVNNFLVDYQQSQATKLIDRQVRLKKDMQSLADNLGISFGVGRRNAKKVSAAIQDFGEGKLTKQNLVDQFGADQAGRIMDADKWFRSQYDTLLEEANKALTTHGYDPIPKRKDYYTHFSEPTLWQKFGLKMQEIKDAASPTMQDAMPTQVRGRIPNKLAGQSEYLEPNKKFNPFAQQRKGEQHTSDAFQSFERYLSPTLNNIYMTPAITRGRVLAKAVADTADLEGKDAKQAVVQIREWANRLAGKSNRLGDRQAADTNWGPNILKGLGWLQRRAGANSIVGNISTAALQPIVLAQTTGKFGVKNTLLAIAQETSTAHSKNAPIRFSQFMRRRYSDLAPVTRGKIDRAADIANMPLKVVEETSARITWNAAYNDALSKGFAGKQAVKYADINAEKTLAGRSIGERPEIFESKTLGNLTMYQLEVANYIQQVAKEMTPKQVMKTFAAAYAFNTVLQQATGRQVGFNPIDAAIDSWAEVNKDGKTPGEKATTIGQRWAGEVVDNMPLAGPTLAWAVGDKRMKEWTGKDSNVGRFGVASPVSTVINNPWMLAAPFGGSQVKKTYSGVSAVASGELKDKEGKTLVNIPQTPGNFAKGALFGKSAIPEVKAYYDNIGKKKVDQMTVPNQVNSKAAKMGGINNGQLMPNAGAESFSDSSIDVNERVKQAMTTPKAKELLALKEGERKAWSQQSAENNALYQEYSVMKKMLEARKNAPTLPAGIIDPNIIKFKQQENAFTDTGKERWYQKFDKNAEEIYGNAQKMLPQNFLWRLFCWQRFDALP